MAHQIIAEDMRSNHVSACMQDDAWAADAVCYRDLRSLCMEHHARGQLWSN